MIMLDDVGIHDQSHIWMFLERHTTVSTASSWTICSLRTDPTHEVGQRAADLIGAILLEEMAPFHRYFVLVRPSAAKLSLPAYQNRTGIRIDEELWHIGFGEPAGIIFDYLHHVSGLAIDRNHSRPRERGPAVFARSDEGLAVSSHFLLTEPAYDRVRQHSFNEHVPF